MILFIKNDAGYSKRTHSQNKWIQGDTAFYLLLTVLMLVKFLPFGLRYYPYMDDYNAYGVLYHLLRGGEKPFALYLRYGMYTSRPLVGLMDVYVLAPLWNRLNLVLPVFVLLHAATLPLLHSVFKRCGLPWGRVASAVFGLYPLLAESAYWINASSRIVTGFFLLALSAYFLSRRLSPDGARVYDLPAAAVTALLSMGFYEQTISVGFVMYGIIVWHSHRDLRAAGKRGRRSWFIWPFAYVGVIGAYYGAFINTGRLAERAVLANKPLLTQVLDVLAGIARLLTKEQRYNIYSLLGIEGPRFARQFGVYGPPLAVALALVCGLALLAYRRDSTVGSLDAAEPSHKAEPHGSTNDRYRKLYTAACMLLLFLAAFGPFFLLRGAYLNLRSLFFAVPVIAMLAECLWRFANRLCARRRRIARIAATVIFAGAVFACTALNMASVSAFRVNYTSDRTIATHVLDTLHDGRSPSDYRKVWLFGAWYQYEPHGGVHMETSTLSDWALTGLVNTLATETYGERYALSDGSCYMNPVVRGWTYQWDIDLERDLLLAVDAGTRIRVLRLEGDVLVYDADGTDTGVFGYIERTGDSFQLRQND